MMGWVVILILLIWIEGLVVEPLTLAAVVICIYRTVRAALSAHPEALEGLSTNGLKKRYNKALPAGKGNNPKNTSYNNKFPYKYSCKNSGTR